MGKRYIVGIDLGTTNCAVGYVDLHDVSPGSIEIKSFDISQLMGMGRLGKSRTLPSFLYLPTRYESENTVFALPWDEDRDYAVGVYARDQGALVPKRLVSSAKSWLCHGGVDRDAPILPWGGADDVKKISPIEASSRYLQHIKEAWEYEMKVPLEEQDVIITVPASFDQVARELTQRAARDAGLTDVILLEEPLASFYAWLSQHEGDWTGFLRPGEILLVCDVGGGTTDFTLVSCEKAEEGPRLERVAVGNHLLLGGDNIDLAISAICEKRIGRELTTAQWQNLFHQARQAKERLLSGDGIEETSVRLVGRGRSLVGGTLTVTLKRDEVERAILDGFFPEIELDAGLKEAPPKDGLREMGLPYEKDPAVTRHLARFILRQGEGRIPDVILFNGGALKPLSMRNRISAVLSSWKGEDVPDIESQSLDLAISVGACYYGLVRMGLGLRVGGGIPRAYFVGLTTPDKDTKKALCLLERGSEEGKETEVQREFKVFTNRPVKFTLFSSTTRRGDKLGDVVEINEKDFVRLPPLRTVLKYGKRSGDKAIPVRVGSGITAIGTLELFCRSLVSPHKWRLQFDLRAEDKKNVKDSRYHVEGIRIARPKEAGTKKRLSHGDKASLKEAEGILRACFGEAEGQKVSPRELISRLTAIFGMGKELWSMPVLRGFSDMLLDLMEGRKRDFMHEARWFNLAGFCLRPGFGDELDPWRIKKVWPLYFKGLFHVKKLEARLQWWIFWIRVSVGLSSGQQTKLFSMVSPVLFSRKKSKRKRSRQKVKVFKPQAEEARQMWLFAGNLERLDIENKVKLGEEIISVLPRSSFKKDLLWALSRIGARIPLYGPANKVVSQSVVKKWIDGLKKMDIDKELMRPFVNSVVSMARVSGDRARDLAARDREDICLWLELLGAGDEEILPVREYQELHKQEWDTAFGEQLPEGLVLFDGEEEE